MGTETKIPAIPDPTTPPYLVTIHALQEVAEVREGRRGDPLDAFVSKRDLYDLLENDEKTIDLIVEASNVVGSIDHGSISGLGDDDHTQYLLADGSRVLSADWDIGNGRMIEADKIQARDGDGLALYEDGGTGIFVEDGGYVGFNETSPVSNIHVTSDQSGKPEIRLENQHTGNTGSIMAFLKDAGASTADYDLISEFIFYARNDAQELINFTHIDFRARDVSDGDEAGSIDFYVRINTAPVEFLTLSGYEGSVGEGLIEFNHGVVAYDIDFIVRTQGSDYSLMIEGDTGNVGIGKQPGDVLDINLSTEDLAISDAGSAAATEQDWIEVTVGGNTGYIRVFAAK
jgi:hypothetical protein